MLAGVDGAADDHRVIVGRVDVGGALPTSHQLDGSPRRPAAAAAMRAATLPV